MALYSKILSIWILVVLTYTTSATHATTAVVKIGAILSLNTSTGMKIKLALDHAVKKVNEDDSLLKGIKLELLVANSGCHTLQSALSAMQLLDNGVFALMGPQSSAESYIVAQMAGALKVPVVSFSSTDPSLSNAQYPYFVRVVPSESVHMLAISDMIRYYGWKEIVALFIDDPLGRNTVKSLEDSIMTSGSRIVFKAALNSNTDRKVFQEILLKILRMRNNIFVVYVPPNLGRIIISTALRLGMLKDGYVWVVNDGILKVLNEIEDGFHTVRKSILSTRQYIPLSSKYKSLHSEMAKDLEPSYASELSLSLDPFFAYDALWIVTKAVDKMFQSSKYMQQNSNLFGYNYSLREREGLIGGSELLYQILRSKHLGITGPVEFDSQGDRLNSTIEFVNINSKGLEVVGYWSSDIRNFTVHHPLAKNTSMLNITRKGHVLSYDEFPGAVSKVPVGSKPEIHLRIIIPNKVGYRKLVNITVGKDNKTQYSGFCIDVFRASLKYIPYKVSYSFTAYGNGYSNPSYTNIIKKVANKEFDAAVGDIAIISERLRLVDFTLPFVDSGIVVAVPKRVTRANRIWGFLEPFTLDMWCTMGAFFIFTGIVIWLLEHKKNEEFQGKWKTQLLTSLWFIMSTLFSAHKESVKTALGRAVLIIWLFVVLIITSSYTANLISILTIEQLRPSINGIAGLITTKAPIAYQSGSYVKNFLIEMGVPKERLILASSAKNYTNLAKVGPLRQEVGAVVDEMPYIEILLSLSCDFEISGEEVFKGGWGFAFQKGSKLTEDFSRAFLELNENGEIDELKKIYFENKNCDSGGESSQFKVSTFMGLFLITAGVSTSAFIIHCIRVFKSLYSDPAIRGDLSGRTSIGKIVHLSRHFSKKLIEESPPRENVKGRSSVSAGDNCSNHQKRRYVCSSMVYKCTKKRRATYSNYDGTHAGENQRVSDDLQINYAMSNDGFLSFGKNTV